MTCPHCGCNDYETIGDRDFCTNEECLLPISEMIPCSTCGVEIEAQDDIETGEKTIIKDCPDCYYDLVNEGE